jgi:urease accessory protein
MIIAMTEAALYRLMTWHDWVEAVVGAGAGRSDAALFVAAFRAAATGDEARLDEIADLAAAWRGTRETALESAAQGTAFLATTRAAWPHPTLDALAARRQGVLALPVAVAIACAVHGVTLPPALTAYLHALAGNLVSAGVRLVPLGQTDGQRCVAALATPIAAAVERALASDLDDVGTAAPVLDWCSMRHETQYTRLFRS